MDSPSWEKVAMEVPERIIVVQDVLFGFDSYQIATRYFNFLDALAYDLAIEKDLLITIEGHTDAIGSNSYNRKLALKRAIAVSNYLQAKGVETNRIKVFSRGESDPVAINNNADGSDNAEGRKFNRRVSITIQAQREDVIIQKDTIIPPVLRKK
jgi:OOP family OmpA-OmpF porin